MACLRKDILSHTIAPNERLVAHELSQRYGLGLSPIREATQELASIGFIDYQPNVGAYVTPLTTLELRSLMRFLIFHFEDYSSDVAFQAKAKSATTMDAKQHADILFHFIQLTKALTLKPIHVSISSLLKSILLRCFFYFAISR